MAPRRTEVIMVWREGDEFRTLAYNSGKGQVRVYHRDQYDGRCDLGREPRFRSARAEPLPYFAEAHRAAEHMAKRPGLDGMCQVQVRAAGSLGFKRHEMAAVSTL